MTNNKTYIDDDDFIKSSMTSEVWILNERSEFTNYS